jgi:flagellar basal-body rod protein FlgB
MLNKLQHAFDFQESALKLRAKRQEVIASNIANDTTPGYKAKDIDFAQQLASKLGMNGEITPSSSSSATLQTTDARHFSSGMEGMNGDGIETLYRTPFQSSIDGNTVELESEKSRSTDNAMHYLSVSNSLQQDFSWWSKFLQDTR